LERSLLEHKAEKCKWDRRTKQIKCQLTTFVGRITFG
jgi:hypothetical protein